MDRGVILHFNVMYTCCKVPTNRIGICVNYAKYM